jgi:hypothetical protein
LTTLAVVVLACLEWLGLVLGELVDLSEAGSEVGEEGASLEVLGV